MHDVQKQIAARNMVPAAMLMMCVVMVLHVKSFYVLWGGTCMQRINDCAYFFLVMIFLAVSMPVTRQNPRTANRMAPAMCMSVIGASLTTAASIIS